MSLLGLFVVSLFPHLYSCFGHCFLISALFWSLCCVLVLWFVSLHPFFGLISSSLLSLLPFVVSLSPPLHPYILTSHLHPLSSLCCVLAPSFVFLFLTVASPAYFFLTFVFLSSLRYTVSLFPHLCPIFPSLGFPFFLSFLLFSPFLCRHHHVLLCVLVPSHSS